MTSGLIKGNFQDLDGFSQQLQNTIQQIDVELTRMVSEARNILAGDWADGGSERFDQIHNLVNQAGQKGQELVTAIRGGVQTTNTNLQTALQQSIARIGSTSI